MNEEQFPALSRNLTNPGHENEQLRAVGTQKEWEEAVFRNATHFNVFRLYRRRAAGTFPKREATAYYTFPEAVADAAPDLQALVYAVTEQGNNFCVPRPEWPKYQQIWEQRDR